MRNLILLILLLSNVIISFAQKRESELLKEFNFYVEENLEMGKWKTKHYLSEGRVSSKENYWKGELRSRTEFEYDEYGNVIQEKNTYNISEEKEASNSICKLEYANNLLISKKFCFGMTELYSDFNKFGKPKLIERIEESEFKIFPYKELIEYDDIGNIIKEITFNVNFDSSGNTKEEKATTSYKYDNRNSVIEIHREFDPKQEFPIVITGALPMYELENYTYKYNEKGLWTKKYKIVEGEKDLVVKRSYYE